MNIGQLVGWLVDLLKKVIPDLLVGLLETLKAFWRWIVESLKAFGDGVLETLSDAIVALMPTAEVATINGWLQGVNYFVPLSEAISLSTVVFTVWAFVWGYRVVKSWIPTVSGT